MWDEAHKNKSKKSLTGNGGESIKGRNLKGRAKKSSSRGGEKSAHEEDEFCELHDSNSHDTGKCKVVLVQVI
jgi:hypothetical protein